MCAHTSLGTQPIYLFGSDEQKAATAARPLRRAQARRVRADRARGRLRRRQRQDARHAGRRRRGSINGAKQFITNAGTDISGHVTITARTGDERDLQPHRRERHARLRAGRAVSQDGLERLGHPAADLRRLPCARRTNLLGPRGQGFSQFLQILDIGRIGVAAMGVGLAQGALDEALKYAKERQAFGQPISKFQSIQAKLADMATEIEAARLLPTRRRGSRTRAATSRLTAAQAKLKTGRLAVRASEEAVQIHGGYGYIEEYPVCRFYRDAKILTIGEGTDEIQQMVIARALGA